MRKQMRPKSEYGRDPIVQGETNIKRRMRGAVIEFFLFEGVLKNK